MAISRPLAQLTALLILATASFAVAQRPTPIPKDDFSSAGEIKGVQGGVFHVANIGGDQWLVKIDPAAKQVVLKGKATPDWLRPGMPVTFRGRFFKNKSGQPQGEAREPIEELKVFSLREDSKAGLKEEARRGSFLAGGPKEDTPLEVAPFTVTGMLIKYKSGMMTVALGQTQVKAQLARDAEIDVDIDDPRFAREGDEIEFEGWHYVGQKKQIHATKVWITIAAPLGGDKLTKGRLAKNTAADDSISDEHRQQARDIQLAITRARRSYEAGSYREAAKAVESIVSDWEAFLDSDKETAAKLLPPHYEQLKKVHAFLEMEGFMLPDVDELAAR